MRRRTPIEENEKVKKNHFQDTIKENQYMCYVCGMDLWDERKHRIRHNATYRFRGAKTGDLLFACRGCGTLVARIKAEDMKQ